MRSGHVRTLAIGLLACVSACGDEPLALETPPLTYGGGDFLQVLRQDEITRSYRVHVPAGASPDRAAPLLLVFHGAGQTSAGIRSLTRIEELADPEGYITVYPEGFETVWAVGSFTAADQARLDDVRFTRRIIDAVSGSLNIDRERVFATGLSNGGVFTHRLACDLGDRIAAIASVAATMLDNLAARCTPARPVSTLFFLGTQDAFFPWEGIEGEGGVSALGAEATLARWAQINGCDAVPAITMLPDLSSDGTTVELRDYRGCANGARVEFFVIEGGGHTWPGRDSPFQPFGRTTHDIDANVEMLDFFRSVDRP